MSGGGIQVTKPLSAWNKPLKDDFKELFKALSKTAVHGVTREWTKAGIATAEAIAAVDLEDDPRPVSMGRTAGTEEGRAELFSGGSAFLHAEAVEQAHFVSA